MKLCDVTSSYLLCREGDDPQNYYVFLLNGYTNALYWSFGLTLIALEYFNKPKEFHKYKIQKDSSALNDMPKLRNVRESESFFEDKK